MTRSIVRILGAGTALSLIALTGCGQTDPLTRPYAWHPIGVNAMNISAMAAQPSDLTRGRHTDKRRAASEADAADRLFTGKPTPLLSGGGGGGGGGGAAGGGGGGGGGSAGGGS